jgi:hypothetical protein
MLIRVEKYAKIDVYLVKFDPTFTWNTRMQSQFNQPRFLKPKRYNGRTIKTSIRFICPIGYPPTCKNEVEMFDTIIKCIRCRPSQGRYRTGLSSKALEARVRFCLKRSELRGVVIRIERVHPWRGVHEWCTQPRHGGLQFWIDCFDRGVTSSDTFFVIGFTIPV